MAAAFAADKDAAAETSVEPNAPKAVEADGISEEDGRSSDLTEEEPKESENENSGESDDSW